MSDPVRAASAGGMSSSVQESDTYAPAEAEQPASPGAPDVDRWEAPSPDGEPSEGAATGPQLEAPAAPGFRIGAGFIVTPGKKLEGEEGLPLMGGEGIISIPFSESLSIEL